MMADQTSTETTWKSLLDYCVIIARGLGCNIVHDNTSIIFKPNERLKY